MEQYQNNLKEKSINTLEVENILNELKILGNEYRGSKENSEEIQGKIKEKISTLSKDELINNINRIPFTFRTGEYNSLEKLDEKIHFDINTKNNGKEVLQRYVDYPEVLGIILETTLEAARARGGGYTSEKAKEHFKLLNQDDIYEAIKLMENNFSGNEARLISRITELGENFFIRWGKEYLNTVKSYKNAPGAIEIMSRNIESHYRNWDLEEQIGIKTSNHNIRAEKLLPFYSNPNIKRKIEDRYNQDFFFLVELKENLLNKNSEGIKNFSILKKFNLKSSNQKNKTEDTILKNLSILKNFKFFLQNCKYEQELGASSNLLLKEAQDRGLLTQEEKEQLLVRLDQELVMVKIPLYDHLSQKYQVPDINKKNEDKIIKYLSTQRNGRFENIKFDWDNKKLTFNTIEKGCVGYSSYNLVKAEFLEKLAFDLTRNENFEDYILKLQEEYFNKTQTQPI